MRLAGVLLLAACGSTAPEDTASVLLDTSDEPLEASPCERLEIGASGTLDFGSGWAWGERLQRTLTLTNSCERSVRFLGHPDDWVQGEGFDLLDLPPIRLEPGESTTLTLRFTPAEDATATGSFVLPTDTETGALALDLVVTIREAPVLVFVGEGRRVATTADYGETWLVDSWDTLETHTNALQRGGCYGDAGFLAVGGSDIRSVWWSEDGVTWTADDIGSGWNGDCAYGGGTYLTAGGFATLHASTDGDTWSTGGSPSGGHLRATAWGEGRWVSVGDDRLTMTEDGATFAVDRDAGGARLSRVTHGAGTWVAGGVIPSELGGTAADVGVLWTSRDGGVTWTVQVLGEGRTVRGLAFVDGQFLLADGASLFRSGDGEEWEVVNAFGMELLGGFGQRLFAASGAGLHRSDDGGFSWTEVHADDAGPSFMELMVGVQP
jgi:hypothetical protein